MIGSGDEEKIKKSKSTIFYVIIGLLVIYFAYTIVAFVFDVFDTADDVISSV
jgi:Na+-driven multidrug efflux pump